MPKPRPPLAHLAAALVAALLVSASALAQPYQNPRFGLTFAAPAGWELLEVVEDDLDLFVTMLAPSQAAGLAVGAMRLEPDELADAGLAALAAELDAAVAGIGDEFPGARATRIFDRQVAGQAARGFDFESPDVQGTLVYLVAGDLLITLAAFAEPPEMATARGQFEELVASLAPGGSAVGPGGSGATDPIGLAGDPWLETFRGDELEMTLESNGGGAYAGQLRFQGQAFALRAQGGPGQLSGVFASGGTEFPFTASESGGSVTFVTGGTAYLLRR